MGSIIAIAATALLLFLSHVPWYWVVVAIGAVFVASMAVSEAVRGENRRRGLQERKSQTPQGQHAARQLMTRSEKSGKLAAYYNTPAWKAKRLQVLKRDNYECLLCGARATHVHHRSYRHVYSEPLDDLVSLCWQCHEKFHGRPLKGSH